MKYEFQVLLIEDSPAETRLFRAALDHLSIRCRLESVSDGLQGLDWLLRRPPFENAPRPELIVLNINLPRLDGLEVISRIRLIPQHKLTPVVVFSTGLSSPEIRRVYERGASCFIRKPAHFDEYLECVQTYMVLWTRFAALPRPDA